jgi:hypothetical protein
MKQFHRMCHTVCLSVQLITHFCLFVIQPTVDCSSNTLHRTIVLVFGCVFVYFPSIRPSTVNFIFVCLLDFYIISTENAKTLFFVDF